MTPTCAAPAPLPSRSDPSQAPPTFSSGRLFGGAQVVFIEHAGQRYTLRITRENKLILTK
jgi:hemin uptake protein HemP